MRAVTCVDARRISPLWREMLDLGAKTFFDLWDSGIGWRSEWRTWGTKPPCEAFVAGAVSRRARHVHAEPKGDGPLLCRVQQICRTSGTSARRSGVPTGDEGRQASPGRHDRLVSPGE